MPCLSRVSTSSLKAGKPPRYSADNISAPSGLTATETEPPEGGLEAWCTVLGCESPSAISWIGSIAAFLVTGMGPICGPLFDRGYFYHVWISGAILLSFSIFVLSFVKPGSYYQILLSQGLGCGIAQGLMYVPSFAVLSHHFSRRRTAMASIVASGVPLGGIFHTIMLNKLLNGSVGFQTGVRASAAFISGLLFLSCLLVRPRYGSTQKTMPVNFWKATKECFTEVPSLLTIFGFMLCQTAFMYPFFYFQIDSLRHGLSTSFSFYSLVIINAGSFIGRFCIGLVTPFIGIVDLTIVATVVCAILIIGMIWLGTVVSVVVIGTLYGLSTGMNIAMMAPMLALTSDPAELGVRMGVGFAIIGTNPICGALLTSRYIWWRPALFCGVCLFEFHVLRVVVAHIQVPCRRLR
ncbi:MFS general substrate transporter [Melanogaster broomeanus]|nr:MFS general substrate transporter [Melanogaster broomeanus]